VIFRAAYLESGVAFQIEAFARIRSLGSEAALEHSEGLNKGFGGIF